MKLTGAETEIIDVLKRQPDASNQDIADLLGKSKQTIENQFRGLYKKIGIAGGDGTTKRIQLFIKLGWLQPWRLANMPTGTWSIAPADVASWSPVEVISDD